MRYVISHSQQTGTINSITETSNQTINHTDNRYLNSTNIATVILNPTPSIQQNSLWIPEVSDNAAPGLDPMLTYNQSKYATLPALQNAITNIKKKYPT